MSKTFIGSLRAKATEGEKQFYRLVKDLGLNLVFQKQFKRSNGYNYFIDFRFKLTRTQLHKLREKKWNVKPSKCIKHHLLVEIDGLYHDKQQAFDFQREQEIVNSNGSAKYHFLRFTNDEVLYNSASVLDRLYAYCQRLWGIELKYEGVRHILLDNQQSPIREYDF